jgi:diadenosine tetraphosphatase ApaH/serine/threonine PP2A family protein phosphatase
MVNERSSWLQRLLGQQSTPPAVPAGRRVYAIGDVHGRRDLLEQLLDRIRAHAAAASSPATNVLLLLGDYIDRGPDSKGVIDLLLGFDAPDWETVFLRGNHDQALLDFLNDPPFYRAWRGYGAPETLLSYGVKPPLFDDEAEFIKARDALTEKLPPAHLAFLQGLANSHEEGDYFFVHAGVRPGIPLDRQMPEDLLWIRDDFLNSNRAFGKFVVHGHTPTEKPVRRSNRLGLDTGAHATGCLTAAALEGENCAILSTSPVPAARGAEAALH